MNRVHGEERETESCDESGFEIIVLESCMFFVVVDDGVVLFSCCFMIAAAAGDIVIVFAAVKWALRRHLLSLPSRSLIHTLPCTAIRIPNISACPKG